LDAYCAQPYEQHQQYINDIFDLTLDYAQDMNRKNSKGKSAKQILIAGCAYQHFRYLQNGSCAIFTLSSEHKRLLSMGTTANEALHAQFNACQRPVVQQHVESMDVVLRSFSLGKLLSHHSAAFSPTLVQRSQGQILSLLEGKLQQSNYHFLAPFGANIPAALAHRRQLRQPVHRHDTDAAVVHKHKLRKQQDRWKLHLRLKPRKHVLKVKRHVFRKRKKPLPVLRPQRK